MNLKVDEKEIKLNAPAVTKAVRITPSDEVIEALVTDKGVGVQFVHTGWGETGEYTMYYFLGPDANNEGENNVADGEPEEENGENGIEELRVIKAAVNVESFLFAEDIIKPSWEVVGIKGICDNIEKEKCDEDKRDEVMAKDGLPNELKNGDNSVDVDYQVTINTEYTDKDAAKASGRTVTTYFTIPKGVTVWYPVWDDDGLTYKSTAEGQNGAEDEKWFVLGMKGHPLSADNIEGPAEIYVALDETTGKKFEFTIKLVDAGEGWEDVVYGEETLTVKRSEYEFEVTEAPISIPVVTTLSSGDSITVNNNSGGLDHLNQPDEPAYEALKEAVFNNNDSGSNSAKKFLASYLVNITLKADPAGDFGYTTRSVKIDKLEVTKNDDGNNENIKVYLYACTGPAWYDLVKTGWGGPGKGNGFNLYKDENTELEAYVFATEPDDYTITFKAIDMANGDNNGMEICSYKVTITITNDNGEPT